MNSGSGIRPEFARDYPGFPWTLTDFRRDKAWALLHLERHQAACDCCIAGGLMSFKMQQSQLIGK
jgi:hypothetical protein